MEFPVRCFSCGAVIGHLYEKYQKLLLEGKTPKEAMDLIGIEPQKYCCRRMFLTHVDVSKEVMQYEKR